MPVYTYQAKDGEGQTVTGEVMAADERMAAGQIRELGYYPMRVERGGLVGGSGLTADPGTGSNGAAVASAASVQAGAAFDLNRPPQALPRYTDIASLGTPHVRPYGTWFERAILFPVWTGVSQRDLALFFRQFAAMLGAGMSVGRALSTLQMQSTGPLKTAAAHMNRHIAAGGKLSEALGMFPHIFTRLQRSIIEASEETGSLDTMMNRISDYLEADAALRALVKRETFLPKINFVATFLIPTLVIAVVRGITAYFTEAVVPLLVILSRMGMVYLIGRYLLTIPQIALVYDTVKSYLPYFGTTVRMLALAKFSRALAALYSSGVLIPRAVEVSSQVAGNEYLSYMMRRAVPAMMSGAGLTESFTQAGVFPPLFLGMLHTGETTGSLDVLLNKIAEYYEGESAMRLHQSVQALNVLIFLVIAVIVGIVVIHFYMGYADQFTNIMNQDN